MVGTQMHKQINTTTLDLPKFSADFILPVLFYYTHAHAWMKTTDIVFITFMHMVEVIITLIIIIVINFIV